MKRYIRDLFLVLVVLAILWLLAALAVLAGIRWERDGLPLNPFVQLESGTRIQLQQYDASKEKR